jgi:hypothetical protein
VGYGVERRALADNMLALKIKRAAPVAFYQMFAMVNGFAIPIIVPILFSSAVSVSIFQYYAVSVIIATVADCIANSINSSQNSKETLYLLSKILIFASILASPVLFIHPWINLSISLSLIYVINNLTAHPGLNHLYHVSPALQLFSTILALAQFIVVGDESAQAFIASLSIFIALSGIAIYALVARRLSSQHFPIRSASRPSLGVVSKGLLSRSVIILSQNSLIAISPYFAPAADVLVARIAFSAQNVSRYFNLLPLSKFALDISFSDNITKRAILTALSSIPLMFFAALALQIYAEYANVSIDYTILSLSIILGLTIFVPFSPHIILSITIRRPIMALCVLCVTGIVAILAMFAFLEARVLEVYVAIVWIMLALLIVWSSFAKIYKRITQ